VFVCLSVRPSVRHKPVLYLNDWTNRAHGLWHRGFFHLSLHCCKEIRVPPKIGVLSSGTLPQTLDLKNFARASRSRCQQHSSSSTTVEFVDDTCTTVNESWLFTTSQSSCTLSSVTLICCAFAAHIVSTDLE